MDEHLKNGSETEKIAPAGTELEESEDRESRREIVEAAKARIGCKNYEKKSK